jgi:hypothetical protein
MQSFTTLEWVIASPSVWKRKTGSRTDFAINTLPPYVLTALINKPRSQLGYAPRGWHKPRRCSLNKTALERLPRLCRDQARCVAGVCGGAIVSDLLFKALEPRWVPTKMGGPGARRFERRHARHFRRCVGVLPGYICAVPPSTNSSMPVTKLESPEARKSAAVAISRGWPMRPIGMIETN